jgi:hypothetical protein
MAAKHTIIQGSSYALDFKTSSYPTLDANWTGTWAIVDALGSGGSTEASGSLTVADDFKTMQMRIAPTDTESITEGNYILVVQIENTTLAYRDEVLQETLTIKAQVIPNP